jgi:hypothetical protein
MTAEAVEEGVGRRRWWQQTTTGADNQCASRQRKQQDWVADYNREGTTVASNVIECRVTMMAATGEDGGSRQ